MHASRSWWFRSPSPWRYSSNTFEGPLSFLNSTPRSIGPTPTLTLLKMLDSSGCGFTIGRFHGHFDGWRETPHPSARLLSAFTIWTVRMSLDDKWPGGGAAHPSLFPSPFVLGNQQGMLWDIGRLSAPQRMDIPVGTAEPVDVAGKFDDDDDCYGWNNETYFSNPHWRNPAWRLPHGRYLVHVVVRSQGETAEGTFRLANDVPRGDFRLEPAMPGDLVR